MTTREFSQAFDALVAAYNNTALGDKLSFDEYEKSVFLTKAQDELIVSFYSGKNFYNEGFENTEEVRRYLSSLIKTKELDEDNTSTLTKLTDQSHIYKLEDDTWFITYESLKLTSKDPCLDGKFVEIIPITQDDLHKLLKNPFKGPNNKRALRLDLADNSVEIIHPLGGKYLVRYLKKTSPIIVDTLDESLDIKGKHEATECELHEALHRTILDRAVQLAVQSKQIASQQK